MPKRTIDAHNTDNGAYVHIVMDTDKDDWRIETNAPKFVLEALDYYHVPYAVNLDCIRCGAPPDEVQLMFIQL
jgi:hypothetical protein